MRNHLNTPVRLAFDEGPATVGWITDHVSTREDGTRMFAVEFQTATHDEPTRMTLPETILVPVCEWVDTYADEWGMACSEPDIPTTVEVPCHFDAQTAVDVDEDAAPGRPGTRTTNRYHYCAEHAARVPVAV